ISFNKMNLSYNLFIKCTVFIRTWHSQVASIHYLLKANTVKQPNDVVHCVLQNVVYKDEQVVVFNKPPGLMTLDETRRFADEDEEIDKSNRWSTQTDPATIQYHMPAFRSALQWENFYPCIRTPKDNILFIICSGITTVIPRKLEDSHKIFVERVLKNGQYLSYETYESSKNALRRGDVYSSYIEHKTLSTNDELKVALVEFRTTSCTRDFIEIYCLRQCAPLLGDHKYWNRVKYVMGTPMYINPIQYKILPAKQ
ncbi:unnamed protein product, partial [Didymodactylos carnosus]